MPFVNLREIQNDDDCQVVFILMRLSAMQSNVLEKATRCVAFDATNLPVVSDYKKEEQNSHRNELPICEKARDATVATFSTVRPEGSRQVEQRRNREWKPLTLKTGARW